LKLSLVINDHNEIIRFSSMKMIPHHQQFWHILYLTLNLPLGSFEEDRLFLFKVMCMFYSLKWLQILSQFHLKSNRMYVFLIFQWFHQFWRLVEFFSIWGSLILSIQLKANKHLTFELYSCMYWHRYLKL